LKFNKKYGVDRLISQETLEILSGYAWPGNVRQLENVIERLVITTDSIIHPRHLPDLIHQHTKERLPDPPFSSLDEALREVERQMVVRSYQKCGSSRKVAADLNVSQNALEIAPLQGVLLYSLRVLFVQVAVPFRLLLLGRLRLAAVSLIAAVLGAAVVGHAHPVPFCRWSSRHL
jgi:hypothetical protein